MNIKINEEMMKRILVNSISLSIAVLVAFVIFHIGSSVKIAKQILAITFPFLIGIGLAFILRLPVMKLETTLFKDFKHRRLISTILIFIAFFFVLILMVYLIIPNIIDSLESFLDNNSEYLSNLGKIIDDIEKRFKIELPSIETYVSENAEMLSKRVFQIANYSLAFIRGLVQFLLAMVSAFYLILDKEKISTSIKKLNYALFNEKIARHISIFFNNAKVVFDKYIVGSLIDSSIIGLCTFLAVALMGMPYAPMISFVIGLTNMIPVFGPFLGAIPVILLLLLIKPIYAVFFAIFIIILQQIDGNVLKPIVLGDRLGLSGFWILFSVTVGGGIGGVLGMFLGVPIFALFYQTIQDFTEYKLKEKHLELSDL